ncbi:hypothetical protein MLD38_025369 [Melastoma candidum]|uniref:Uncharacterized protein n=1 Tax=Melastoma candidum TaxID=119954 RepID=A0ACB9NV39_9MYRT|nr:hypothetical protein MLD38_025369 [Melastoma candidum]
MANSRIARFIVEIAPPQFVCVMRHPRTPKMLETITEEEKEVGSSQPQFSSSPRTPSSSLAPKSAARNGGSAVFRGHRMDMASSYWFKN